MTNAGRQATDVVIIGGGVMGCAIAYELAMRGVGVTVVEQREVAASASGASAGGVRQQGRDLRELPLALRAIPRWPGLAERLGTDVEYRRGGHLTVIEDEAIFPAFAASITRQQEAGLDIRLVEPRDLEQIMPGVAPTVVAGSYTPEDGHANPILTTKAFADAAIRAGARLLERTAMTGFIKDATGRIVAVETTAGVLPCCWAVNAAGAWAGETARLAGSEIPLRPACYQMLVTPPPRRISSIRSSAASDGRFRSNKCRKAVSLSVAAGRARCISTTGGRAPLARISRGARRPAPAFSPSYANYRCCAPGAAWKAKARTALP